MWGVVYNHLVKLVHKPATPYYVTQCSMSERWSKCNIHISIIGYFDSRLHPSSCGNKVIWSITFSRWKGIGVSQWAFQYVYRYSFIGLFATTCLYKDQLWFVCKGWAEFGAELVCYIFQCYNFTIFPTILLTGVKSTFTTHSPYSRTNTNNCQLTRQVL